MECPACKRLVYATTDGYACISCKFFVSYIGTKKLDWKSLTVFDQMAIEDAATRFGIAQSLLDGIASNSSGLEVRDIL